MNIYPGSGWLLTALAFDGAQLVGNTGFTHGTFYNTGVDHASGNIVDRSNELSNGTVAAGANFVAWNNQYNLRIWDYQFQNYGNLLYADNSITFHTSKSVSFGLAAQGAVDRQLGDSNNAMTNDGLGLISSNQVGLQGEFVIDFFDLKLAYTDIWGPGNAYGQGAIVSPFTYGFATDPIYTTPYLSGLVELGTAGQIYKLSPSFKFLNGNLSISPAWSSFITPTPQWNGTNEYDLVFQLAFLRLKD